MQRVGNIIKYSLHAFPCIPELRVSFLPWTEDTVRHVEHAASERIQNKRGNVVKHPVKVTENIKSRQNGILKYLNSADVAEILQPGVAVFRLEVDNLFDSIFNSSQEFCLLLKSAEKNIKRIRPSGTKRLL